MNILLGRILDGDKKEAKDKPKKERGKPKKTILSAEEMAEALRIEEEAAKLKAEKEVMRRAQKRLDEIMKKEDEEMNALRSKQKRIIRNESKENVRMKMREDYLTSLLSPTKRLKWGFVDDNESHLRGFLDTKPVLDIKRGVISYTLHLGDALALRAKNVGMRNNFSSFNVYDLKTKAETVLKRIENLERDSKRRGQ